MRSRLAVAVLVASIAIPASSYQISTWIPPWDPTGLSSVQSNARNMDESNPVWYSLNASGAVVKNWNAEDQNLRAAMTGTRIVPTIQNYVDGRFNGPLVASLLSTSAGRETHAEELTRLAVMNAFDGIDIDYEGLPATARLDFTSFVSVLSSKLHGAGKKLSVTVHAKTSDTQNWNGPGSQDWVSIGNLADSVKIMSYDYHWSTSDAGEIAPLAWLESVAGYAASVMPAAKIMMGIPWYGYDWQGRVGKTVVHKSALALAAANGAVVSHTAGGEATFNYADHVVYFQDAISYSRKVDAITNKVPGIGGFAHWLSGAEDPLVWQKVAQIRSINSGGSGGTAPAGTFEVTGPQSVTVAPKASVKAIYSVVNINGFSSPIDVKVESIDALPGSVTLSATRVAPGQPVSLTVTANSKAGAGNYRLNVRFTSGTIEKTQLLTVTVSSSPRGRAAKR